MLWAWQNSRKLCCLDCWVVRDFWWVGPQVFLITRHLSPMRLDLCFGENADSIWAEEIPGRGYWNQEECYFLACTDKFGQLSRSSLCWCSPHQCRQDYWSSEHITNGQGSVQLVSAYIPWYPNSLQSCCLLRSDIVDTECSVTWYYLRSPSNECRLHNWWVPWRIPEHWY